MVAPPLSEDDLIDRFFAPLAGPGGLGLRDDAALMDVPAGFELVLTNDALVAGVHFFPHDPPADIARKALRTNLSDLAAKGADPAGYLLALALPKGWNTEWLAEFALGLRLDGATYAIALLGGDTVKTPGPLMVSITALGFVPKGKMVRRTGVRAGDALYVTGTIGDAALGLRLRLDEVADKAWTGKISAPSRAWLLESYLLPRPRNLLATVLRSFATGGMDVSDGFVGDLTKMLKVSGCGAKIELANVPLSNAACEAIALQPSLLELALTGGDDYEVICSVAAKDCAAFEAGANAAEVSVSHIGAALPGSVMFLGRNGQEHRFIQGSFSHF